jgi:hypothetical protein
MMFRVVFWDILPCKMIVDRRFIPEDNSEHEIAVLDHHVSLNTLTKHKTKWTNASLSNEGHKSVNTKTRI